MMKRNLFFNTIVLIFSLLTVMILLSLNCFSVEIDGFTFEDGSFYEITTSVFLGTPSTVEATVYLSDNTAVQIERNIY